MAVIPSIEQQRRDFMTDNRSLYNYIEAHFKARVWKEAGDLAGGAIDNYGAANRCYAQEGRWLDKIKKLRDAHGI